MKPLQAVKIKGQVLVLGGGVIGLCTALYLAEAGARVTVLERDEFARQASWAGGGILSPLYPWRAPDPVWRLASRGIAIYPQLCADLARYTGVDPEWTGSGLLLRDRAEHSAATRFCHAEGLALHEGRAPGSLLLPWVAQLRNPRMCRALLMRLEQLGVTLRAHCGPLRLALRGDKAQVMLADEALMADQIVVAAGAWSGLLLAETGWQLPIKPVAGQMILLQGKPDQIPHIILADGRYLIPRRDGQILVGSTLEDQGFTPHCTETALRELLLTASELAPETKNMPVLKQWAGLRPGSPDGIPTIARHPQIRNLFVNAGHYRNGINLAPGSAMELLRLLASAS